MNKELLVARIISGRVRLKLPRNEHLLLMGVSRDRQYAAQELYVDTLEEGLEEGLFDDNELLDWMIQEGHWDEERAKLLTNLPKEIEEFKVQMFKLSFRTAEKNKIRLYLNTAKEKLMEVSMQRHAWDHISAAGNAAFVRSRYLFGCALHTQDGRPVFNLDRFWESESAVLEQGMFIYSRLRINEPEYRELARSEPWSSLWSTRKCEASLFGVPVADYTEEQRAMVGWAQLYTSIYEHPERPPDDVVADDDCLDGWLIDQKRQHEKAIAKSAADELTGGKNKNAEELYLVADSVDDARRIETLNSEMASAIKRKRFKHLKEKGEVSEQEMPDTRQRVQMQKTNQFMDSVKGKG